MKKYLAISGLVMVLIAAFWLWSITQKQYDLPAISYQTIDGQIKHLNIEAKGSNTLVVMFRSNCGFCGRFSNDLYEISEEFEDINVIYLSRETTGQIRAYQEAMFPHPTNNLQFGSASITDMDMLANDELVYPYLIWFSKQGEVRVRHTGYANPGKILEVINKNS